jgi:hypothetical protein
MRRRLLAIGLALPLAAAGLAACGDDTPGSDQANTELLRESATSTVPPRTTNTPQNNVPTEGATTAAQAGDPVVVPLRGDVTGSVTLLDTGNRRTRVTLAVQGGARAMAAEIVRGECGDDEARGSTKAELTVVRDGRSDTEVLVPADSILNLEHVVLVHRAASTTSPVAACAELDEDAAGGAGTSGGG